MARTQAATATTLASKLTSVAGAYEVARAELDSESERKLGEIHGFVRALMPLVSAKDPDIIEAISGAGVASPQDASRMVHFEDGSTGYVRYVQVVDGGIRIGLYGGNTPDDCAALKVVLNSDAMLPAAMRKPAIIGAVYDLFAEVIAAIEAKTHQIEKATRNLASRQVAQS